MFTTRFAAVAALLAIGAGTAAAAPTTRFSHEASKATVIEKKSLRSIDLPRKEGAAAMWCAKNEVISFWEGGEWLPVEAYTKTFDSRGLITREIMKDLEGETYSLTENTYDGNGMRVLQTNYTSEDGQVYYNSSKKANAYDSRVTDFTTACYEYFWYNDDWAQIGNNWERTLTRDEKGNVTGIQTAVLYQGIFDPTIRVTVEYGDDGKAYRIKQQMLDYNGADFFWRDGASISDIVWAATDGQITDPDNLYTGNNRIASAHLSDAENDVDINVVYRENGYTATRTGVVQGYENASATVDVTVLDANGSIKLVETFTVEEDGETYVESYTDIEMYDAFGYTTLISNNESYPDKTGLRDRTHGGCPYLRRDLRLSPHLRHLAAPLRRRHRYISHAA